jgi:FKBP-type peptidyl-prolyl cis-trans isomerase FklB
MKRVGLIATAVIALAVVAVVIVFQQKRSPAGDAPEAVKPAAAKPEPGKPKATKPAVKNEAVQVGYGVGLQVGRNFRRSHCDFDLAAFARGFHDGFNRKAPKMPEEKREKMLDAYFRKKYKALPANNKTDGKAFLAGNRKVKGVQETRSGLQYLVLREGTGAVPKATDRVEVHYTGALLGGTVFDSSVRRGKPTTFRVNGVIKGWIEGLQLMKVGAKYKFFIPGNLAYGDRPPPRQGLITPNALLVFDLELLSIVK